ncbi:UbiX family flavin prenyltransferase [Haladaptatus sp. DJG-WS-42]|uniref:UbiX family flavin prenyltransferase n=1 Tax=Haladaptatus sp. DJG-WS-42 TaxID=3120516 RepID=UPI0030CED021
MAKRIIVGMTGATGQIFGVSALELLRDTAYESHLVLSEAGAVTLKQELSATPQEVIALATTSYQNRDIGASIASGSFETAGMLVAPCSMKTLSNIAHGNTGNLVTRAADVTLKERRPLVVMPREKPFNRIHLQNMLAVTDAGGIIMPPFPSYYQGTNRVEETTRRTVARALNLLGVGIEIEEWHGLSGASTTDS